MIKDKLLKLVFTPLLGILISYVSGIITYNKYSGLELAGSFFYFVFVSFCIWRGCQWIHLRVRRLYTINQNAFLKIAYVCMISGIYGIAIAGMFGLTWFRISREIFSWTILTEFILFSLLAVIVFTLLYEILYLSKEREWDTQMVVRLDKELTRAEMMALRNELDPHFIFNSLTALSYLISSDSKKADVFNQKLAEVYKYFLINKEKELVTLEKEIEFIKNYFFLLTIRHDNKLNLYLDLDDKIISNLFIIPCALQILVENAIKHNAFSQEQPLNIYLSISENYVVITSEGKQKQSPAGTTKVGLKNLGAQYRLLAKKNIEVEDLENKFVVKLPIIRDHES